MENSLHWIPDVIFQEDDARIRVGHAAQNMAALHQLALNVLKTDHSKGSKYLRAAPDTAFLQTLLEQF